MNELSQLYPDLIIGNALRGQNVSDNHQMPYQATTRQQGLFGGGLDYSVPLGNGLLNSTITPHQLLFQWTDLLNRLRIQGGINNWRVNYERKF